MKRVTGLGGIFFKSEDPNRLYEWYEKHLGLEREPDGSAVVFRWRQDDETAAPGVTVWSIFPKTTTYFGPTHSSFMMNFRVENLDTLLEVLRAEGVQIDEKREEYAYGKFAWITDPEGNRIELWEPPKGN